MTRRKRRSIDASMVGLAALAVAVVALSAFAVLRPLDEPSSAAGTTPGYTPPTTTAAPVMPALGDVLARLEDPARPWTLLVLGDSTGNDPGEWVHLVVGELAEAHGRPAVIHDWDIKTNAYVSETTIDAGEAAPIVVWNGSASGMGGDYSLANFSTLAPERPDLVIVSHGHNVITGDAARAQTGALVAALRSAWPELPAVALTLQSPRVDQFADRQAEVVDAIRTEWTGTEVTLIDVWSAFEAHDVDALIRPDGVHPEPAGSRVWADAVLGALG